MVMDIYFVAIVCIYVEISILHSIKQYIKYVVAIIGTGKIITLGSSDLPAQYLWYKECSQFSSSQI